MVKVLQNTILLIAVFTVTAHTFFPHFHFDDIVAFVQDDHHHSDHQSGTHQHGNTTDDNDHQNSPFSFVQLDEEFIPTNGLVDKIEQPVQYLPVLMVVLLSANYPILTKPKFGRYIEYPPPNDYYYNLPSRAPPVAITS